MAGERILVVNDDGIHAEGIALLEAIARTLSDDVWVVAPEFEQSGTSHSLSLTQPLRLRQVDERKYAVRGSPTDCVILACRHILADRLPTLVLSGINRGANLADDVTYSGTIAAAIEGTLLGIRSIALSQVFGRREDPVKWYTAEQFAPKLLARLVGLPLDRGVFLNVNFPDIDPDAVRGIRVTRQGQRTLQQVEVHERIDARGFPYFWLGFRNVVGESPEDTDVGAVTAGFVSVTPLHCNLTHDASSGAVARSLEG